MNEGQLMSAVGVITHGYDAGIPTSTHLFNAMSPLHHREVGLVGAVFNHHKACSSIIVDGHHVSFEAVKIAKKQMGDRLFMITDAVAACNKGIEFRIRVRNRGGMFTK